MQQQQRGEPLAKVGFDSFIHIDEFQCGDLVHMLVEDERAEKSTDLLESEPIEPARICKRRSVGVLLH
jgi:hypothetical protein